MLTGAGISTESGIPDFRSPETGLWSRFDPELLTSNALLSDPETFYKKGLEVLSTINKVKNAGPNTGHKVLAKLEKEKYIDCIITQNVDGLHREAGSSNVYEVHGNLRDAHCLSCGKKYKFDDIINKIENNQIPPICDTCSGVLRPSVVLFGDRMPISYDKAAAEVKKSDLLVIIGSSLEVSPVNFLPDLARKYIIINNENTPSDEGAYIVWHERTGRALEMIYKEIIKYREKHLSN